MRPHGADASGHDDVAMTQGGAWHRGADRRMGGHRGMDPPRNALPCSRSRTSNRHVT